MVYIDEDYYAKRENFADWDAYALANPDNPSIANLTEWIEEATNIINENIGSFNTDISDSRFLSRIEKLCYRMVKRIEQIDIAQGTPARIPMFSPNDFLIERERIYLRFTVGVTLGYKLIGGVKS